MYFNLYLLTILLSLTYHASCKKSSDSKDRFESLMTSLSALGGLDAGSTSGSASASTEDVSMNSKELKKYLKTMEKKEEKHYKKAMRHMISQEEKDELKYYENMLKQIKILNADH